MPASTHILLGTGAVLSAFAFLSVGSPLPASGQSGATDDLRTASIGRQFEIRSPGDEKICILSKGGQLDGSGHSVALHRACGEMASELAGVTEWVDVHDGSIVLMRADGTKAIEFGLADGVSHESFSPSHLLLTLSERK